MEEILKIENLKVYFPIKKRLLNKKNIYVKAVDNISFYVKKGETVGLVGESGCGKTSTGKAIVGLNNIHEGSITFEGRNIASYKKSELKSLKSNIQMIFQDPYSSLDPRMTIRDILLEPLKFHKKNQDIEKLLFKYLQLTGLRKEDLNRYPHQFSGGQRQRIGIARALALEPKVIIADEPLSALDLSIQAQIINLMIDLQKRLGLSYIFISHDLSVVKHISDRVIVMYLGQIMEINTSDKLYKEQYHPYTKLLISSIPNTDPKKRGSRTLIQGEIPSPINSPRGCKFSTRCPYVDHMCVEVEPQLVEVDKNHKVACHHYKKINR